VDKIRVLIADDHAIVRQGIRSMLDSADEIEVVGEAEDSPSVLRLVRRLSPDVLLLDVRMPGSSGIQIAKLLRETAPKLNILMLSTYESDDYVVGAIEAGARGYLLKDITRDELLTAIRQAYEGHHLLGQAQLDKVLNHFQAQVHSQKKLSSSISDEEVQILKLMAEGCSNKQISERQFWSEITVKRKIQQIFKKLDVTDRAQAVAEAFRRGLI